MRRVPLGARGLWAEAASLGAAVATARAAALYAMSVRTPRVHHRGSRRMKALLAQVPGLHRPLWPGPLHSSVALAMGIGMKLRERRKHLISLRTQLVPHADGGTTALQWAEDAAGVPSPMPPLPDDAPLLLLLHTITASSRELFGLAPLILAARARGWRAAVHVRRGCGGLEVPAGGRWNPFGCAHDLRDALDAAAAAYPAAPYKAAIGISAGSAVLSRYLGEFSPHAHASSLVGAVVIAPGYRMPMAWERVQWPYSLIVRDKLRAHFLCATKQPQIGVGRRAAYEAAMAAQTLPELLDALAPLCGYGQPAQFRERCDPHAVRLAIRTPLLAINSLDDPLSVKANIDYDWFEKEDPHGCAALVTVPRGAHIEFLEWRSAGRLHEPWADTVALDFLEAASREADAPL